MSRQLEMMVEHTTINESPSFIPGVYIGDEGNKGDDASPSLMSSNSTKRGNSTSSTTISPSKKIKSSMVRIMKGIWDTLQTNSIFAQKVMQEELRQ